jgi:hypothetical protein
MADDKLARQEILPTWPAKPISAANDAHHLKVAALIVPSMGITNMQSALQYKNVIGIAQNLDYDWG